MDFAMGLYQEQSQKLVMTMQMKQAIELLQCTAEELEAVLAEESLNNPFAELRPVVPEGYSNWSTRRTGGASPRAGADSLPLEQMVAVRPSMAELLEHQIRVARAEERVAAVARFCIGLLDESGYLTETDEELAAELQCSPALIAEAVALLQRCEPRGIAARSLQECLLLQLEGVPSDLRDLVRALIANHLDDIASGRIPHIAKRLRQPVAEVQRGVDTMRQLSPRPATALSSATAPYVIPEIVVYQIGGEYAIVNNDNALPSIRISPSYLRLLQRTEDPAVERFLTKKYQAAQWMMRCVEQRRQTLYRVAEAIVRIQHRFFEDGPDGLRPLTLRQVADDLGLHESTISRATRGKYMQTPKGVFELKYFFTAEVAGDDGAVSAQAAKHWIRRHIDSEDATRPLSDEALCQQLSAHGIHISRRTVAKYREELNIPSSARRKRFA